MKVSMRNVEVVMPTTEKHFATSDKFRVYCLPSSEFAAKPYSSIVQNLEYLNKPTHPDMKKTRDTAKSR